MSDPEIPNPELLARVARLEAQVAWLTEKLRAGEATDPGLAPPIQRPAPRPLPPPAVRPPRPKPAPRPPMNPIVWVAGAGASIFLLGAIFFLHWSIQRGWLGPELRFLLGLLAGLGLCALSTRLALRGTVKLATALLVAGLGTLVFSLRMGAFAYHFFPPLLGFAGSFVLVLAAGGLAARVRHGGPMAVGLVTGLSAPLVFSEGGHHELSLALYLGVLMAGALAVPYATRLGARWPVSRWLGSVGTWLMLAAACAEVRGEDAGWLLALLLLHLLLAGLWIWLPGVDEEKPSSPTTLWGLLMPTFAALLWGLWKSKLAWMPEAFALPLLALAALNLGLVKPLRLRMENRRADFLLLAFALAFLALAMPVALAWRWVGPIWSGFALALAWAAWRTAGPADWDAADQARLRLLALGMILTAGLRWLVHGGEVWAFAEGWGPFRLQLMPFFNARFAEGALLAASCAFLARSGGGFGPLGLIGLQVVGGITLGVEVAHLVRYSGGTVRSASIALTLVWALLGALQWLRGLGERDALRRALMAGGYGWLGIGSAKLIFLDMATADTPRRALAFLAVGGIFMAAALIGNRMKGGAE